MANPLIALIMLVLDLYWWVVIIAVIVSWLIAFNVIKFLEALQMPTPMI